MLLALALTLASVSAASPDRIKFAGKPKDEISDGELLLLACALIAGSEAVERSVTRVSVELAAVVTVILVLIVTKDNWGEALPRLLSVMPGTAILKDVLNGADVIGWLAVVIDGFVFESTRGRGTFFFRSLSQAFIFHAMK